MSAVVSIHTLGSFDTTLLFFAWKTCPCDGFLSNWTVTSSGHLDCVTKVSIKAVRTHVLLFFFSVSLFFFFIAGYHRHHSLLWNSIMLVRTRKPKACKSTFILGDRAFRGEERTACHVLQKCAATLARLTPSSIMYTISGLQFLTWGEADQWGRLNATAGSPYVVLSERLPAFLLHSEESGQYVFITVLDILAWGSLHKKRNQDRNPNQEGGRLSSSGTNGRSQSACAASVLDFALFSSPCQRTITTLKMG